MAEAGIYLHTADPASTNRGTPVGMPISIAEAMATGTYTLVRNLPALASYVGNAGSTYRDIDEAVRLIAETADWSPEDWRRRELASTKRAYCNHSDDLVIRQLVSAWNDIINPPRPSGRVEDVSPTKVRGWVWNAREPDARLQVTVIRGDQAVRTGTADIFRKDLLRSGIGDGRHAFAIDLPFDGSPNAHSIICRVEALGFTIPPL